MEHITTAEAAAYAASGGDDLGATITVQHLMLDRNDMLVGVDAPAFLLPADPEARHASAQADRSRNLGRSHVLPWHRQRARTPLTPRKEAECCAAGCFTAPVALACLAEVFEESGALDKLEGFTPGTARSFMACRKTPMQMTLTKGDPMDIPEGGRNRRWPGDSLQSRTAPALEGGLSPRCPPIRLPTSEPKHDPNQFPRQRRNRPPYGQRCCWKSRRCTSMPTSPSRWPAVCPRPPISIAAS